MTQPTRELVFDPMFIEDLTFFVHTEVRVALKILRLIEGVRRDPFEGEGKPEPLKHLAAHTWSRRITQEHRLVYQVGAGRIVFLQARFHYEG